MTDFIRTNAGALREVEVRPFSAIYPKVIKLYEEAFVPEERIDCGVLDELASEPAVAYTAYFDADAFCGFSYSIDTGNYLYLLFLAVCAEDRSRGYGTRILGQIKARFPGRIIVLEIEQIDPAAPNAVQRERRLAFYQRNGFAPAGYDSIEGDMTYTVLKTAGAFDAISCVNETTRALQGLIPFELVKTERMS